MSDQFISNSMEERNKIALEEEQFASYASNQNAMNIECPFDQDQAAITETERCLVNRNLYFMMRGFQRVMDTFQEFYATILTEGNTECDSMRLHYLIDNAYAQFKSLSMQFPEKCKEIFQEELDKMKKEADNFCDSLTDEARETLDLHLQRLAALLKLEKTESPNYPVLHSMDPEKIMPIFWKIQETYAQQDEDLKNINEGATGICIPTFNSTVVNMPSSDMDCNEYV